VRPRRRRLHQQSGEPASGQRRRHVPGARELPDAVSFRSGRRRNDYVAKSGTLTFNPGETSKTITIVVNGDNKKEADETFYLDLFGNSSNALFSKIRGIGTILNDD
jgi:hypothetical protein